MKNYLLILLIFSLLYSCENTPEETQPLNPNGDSELALLMRQMRDDFFSIKEDLENNREIGIILKHETILTAEATEPEKAEGTLYKTFAKTYVDLMNELNDPSNSDREATYSKMVNNCIQCHQVLCPGPISVIKKMEIR